MTVLAAQGDTWGISGPAFIQGYIVAAIAAFILTMVLRRLARRGRPLGHELHPYEVAYLAGGPLRALAAVVAAQRADGVIEIASGRRGRLRRTGRSMSVQPTPLDRAVLHEFEERIPLRRLASQSSVQQTLESLREGLARAGLVPDAADQTQLRLATVPLLALLAVGVARLAAGIFNGKPVGYLVAALIVAGVVTLILLLRTPRLTTAGRWALQRARADARHLDPAMSPSWATYGPVGAALGVALFGDPDFDREGAVLGRASYSSGRWSWGRWSSGGYSGGSCSSSSSCGGGSSGGGGGCGGGGGGGCGG